MNKNTQRMVLTVGLSVAVVAAAYRFPETKKLLTGQASGSGFEWYNPISWL